MSDPPAAAIDLMLDTEPSQELVATLGEGLGEHALPFTGTRGFRPIAVVARDENGELVGGVYGRVNWNWLDVSLVWIGPGSRHAGLGSRLLVALEEAARERGCRYAHLDTFSYQARPFYERHGYEVFATLDDYPPGHQRFYLRKDLERAK